MPALDPVMVAAILVLASLGVLNLVAIGDRSLALHQAVSVVLGLVVMVWAWRTPSRWWPWMGRAAYGLALLLLLGVAAHGVEAYGAKRWLDLGSFVLQPSELAELGLVLLLSEVMGQRHWPELRRLGLALLIIALPVGLTLLEPDLSTSALLCLIGLASLVLGRIRWRTLVALVASGLVLLPLGLHLLRPYQLARLHSFTSAANGSGGSFTLQQAHIAIASGGLLGMGHSTAAQLLGSYLPARETDLAFASLVEQFGILAGAAALAAAAVLVWRLAAAASTARTPQVALISGVMGVLIGGEVLLSAGGNLGYLPLAGVPIPFLAYGGTVTVAHLAAIGLILGGRLDTQRRRLWTVPARLRQRPRLARTTAAGLALALILLGGLTYKLQVLDSTQARQAALQEVTRWIPLTPERGLIEDRHGTVLAGDPAAAQVVAVPQLVPRERLPQVAQLLDQTRSTLSRELAQPTHGGWVVTLDPALPAVRATLLQAASVPGVIVEPALGRVYPYGSVLGPILGYTGLETPQQAKRLGLLPAGAQLGQAGLEQEYDAVLRGRYGSQAILVNAQGVPEGWGRTIPPVNGQTLVTSLDLPLQELATRLLQKSMSGAYPGSQTGDQGSLVVLDPQNGRVLAMASWPAYNDQIFETPRNLAGIRATLSAPGSPLLEHATQTAMPPGSNFKLVVSSADVYHHAIPPEEVIPTGASFTYDGHTYGNWETLPPQDLPQAIAWSNDVYFYKLAVALGADNLISTAQAMGVGKPTGIDLPAESPGYLGTPASVARLGQTWYPGSTVIMGIGQGYVTATPLQDAVWTAEVGTGARVTPRLGLAEGPPGAGPLRLLQAPPPVPLPWASALGPVRQGLRLAATQGTASMLNSLNIDAGGKTGTAQDPTAPHGGPDAWFTAMAPMSDPQVVVSMLVRGGGQGYYTDQPAVTQLLRYYAGHRQQITAGPPSSPPGTAGGPAGGTRPGPISPAAGLAPQLRTGAGLP